MDATPNSRYTKLARVLWKEYRERERWPAGSFLIKEWGNRPAAEAVANIKGWIGEQEENGDVLGIESSSFDWPPFIFFLCRRCRKYKNATEGWALFVFISSLSTAEMAKKEKKGSAESRGGKRQTRNNNKHWNQISNRRRQLLSLNASVPCLVCLSTRQDRE